MRRLGLAVILLALGLISCAAIEPKLVIRYDQEGEPIELERLVKGREAVWSPDGKKMAFVQDGIHILDLAKRESPQSLTPAGRNPSWSPDGRYIAYADRGIWLVNLSDGHTRRIADIGHDPAWLADSRQVAYAADGIWAVDINTSQARQLLPKGISPVPAPGNNQLLFEVFNPERYEFDLRRTDLDKNSSQSIVNDATDPAWSPDGNYILYNSIGIWVAENDGRQAQRLTVYGPCPRWSPRGDMILFGYQGYIWMFSSPFKLKPLD